jgi:hypothetical protein
MKGCICGEYGQDGTLKHSGRLTEIKYREGGSRLLACKNHLYNYLDATDRWDIVYKVVPKHVYAVFSSLDATDRWDIEAVFFRGRDAGRAINKLRKIKNEQDKFYDCSLWVERVPLNFLEE